MFSSDKNKLACLAVMFVFCGAQFSWAAPDGLATVKANNLPINVANKSGDAVSKQLNTGKALVSPTKAKANIVSKEAAEKTAKISSVAKENQGPTKSAKTISAAKPSKELSAAKPADIKLPENDDFEFDLKMKSVAQSKPKEEEKKADEKKEVPSEISEADLPKDIQYKANPIEALGNSVLSKMDGDLFSQMSEIEKSTTLLTLELRRERIRNEIEAQKAIRQKNIDERARKLEEDKIKDLERKKKIEAQVLQEKQLLLDKEQMFEILKQRKLLNAYMNQMLMAEQKWLKEKEDLYAQLDAAEQEKKELISMFKTRIDKILEASAKNIQVAEAARTNFERIVKNLKSKNEQLRKRVEADALIIKNAKNSLYLKSQSIDELNDKNAQKLAMAQADAKALLEKTNAEVTDEEVEEEEKPSKLSATYAILGITGRAGNMSIDVIDIDGQPITLKVGSPLPTGHVVSEIGSDYAKFSRDGEDDYLYVGKSIDGIVPNLGLATTK